MGDIKNPEFTPTSISLGAMARLSLSAQVTANICNATGRIILQAAADAKRWNAKRQ